MTDSNLARIVVLASGSGTNLQAIIDQVATGNLAIDIVGVVSDRPAAYALERAKAHNIPVYPLDFSACRERSEYDALLDKTLAGLRPDLIVLAGYMRILPDATVNRYLGQMLNVHPSLLPAYPGLNTYERVLAAGDRWHGTTVHFVTPELDAGPAIIQYRVEINPKETEPSLRDRVQQGEYIIYPQAILWFTQGRIALRDKQTWLDNEPLPKPLVVDEPC